MAKKSSSSASKKKTTTKKTSSNNAPSPRFVLCPYTNQKVFIAQATRQDLQNATSTSSSAQNKQKRLWTIASANTRQMIYDQTAQALALIEQQLIPSYGGRSWEVTVKLSEPNGRVLFRAFRGNMELATLPHLIDRIPKPPTWAGKRFQPPDQYEAMQGEENDILSKQYSRKKQNEYYTSLQYIQNLTTREISTLSSVAYEVCRPLNHPVPTVTIKWKSPDAKSFTSRKAAWEYAEQLSKQEVMINRHIMGVGASGKLLQPFVPSLKTTIEVGKLRFVRDGLWVAGQELSWQNARPEEYELQQQQLEEERAQKTYSSGLQLYIASHRQSYKKKNDVTLTQADKDLRQEWRHLSPTKQDKWNKIVQDQFESESDNDDSDEEESGSDDGTSSEEVKEVIEYISRIQYFIHQRRHKYRYERQQELNGEKFTLAQADKELRRQWKDMTEQEQDDWIAKLEQEQDGETDNETLVGKTEESKKEKNDKMNDDGATTKDESSKCDGKVEMDETKKVNDEENRNANDNHAQGDSSPSPVSPRHFDEEKKEDDLTKARTCTPENEEGSNADSDMSPSGNVETNDFGSPEMHVTSSEEVVSSSDVEIEETDKLKHSDSEIQSSKPSARVKQPPTRATQRWCLKQEQMDKCHGACMEHFDTVMRTVKSRDLSRELADGFDVLRERGRGRFDMELPAFDTPEFNFLNDFKKTPWMPVVRAILGEDVVLIHKGCFLSLPGAGAQIYHQDGVHLSTQTQRPCHAINVFVPLVDLQMKNGPTEFCLGSHVLGHDGYDKDFVETPTPSAGTPIVFDYRLGHRGLANSSHTCRPIVYCTYARAADGKEFRDLVNFSRKRYHKIGDLSAKPLSREERRNKRKTLINMKEEEEIKKALEMSTLATAIGEDMKEESVPENTDCKECKDGVERSDLDNCNKTNFESKESSNLDTPKKKKLKSKVTDLCTVPLPSHIGHASPSSS